MWGYILLTAKTDLGLNIPAFRWGIRDTYFSYGFLHLPLQHLLWLESEYMTKAWSGPGKLLIEGIINESDEVTWIQTQLCVHFSFIIVQLSSWMEIRYWNGYGLYVLYLYRWRLNTFDDYRSNKRLSSSYNSSGKLVGMIYVTIM